MDTQKITVETVFFSPVEPKRNVRVCLSLCFSLYSGGNPPRWGSFWRRWQHRRVFVLKEPVVLGLAEGVESSDTFAV